jgi:hypothetical protein
MQVRFRFHLWDGAMNHKIVHVKEVPGKLTSNLEVILCILISQ